MTDEATKTALAVKQRMTPADRAAANPTSLRLAIDAFCFRCQDDGTGRSHTVKAKVRDCSDRTCHLWPVRGWQHVTTGNASLPPAGTGQSAGR